MDSSVRFGELNVALSFTRLTKCWTLANVSELEVDGLKSVDCIVERLSLELNEELLILEIIFHRGNRKIQFS